MNLREILTEDYFEASETIQGKYLELLLPIISKSTEFKNVHLELYKKTSITPSLSMKLENGREYEGVFWIQSITQTPIIYNPKIILSPVKDGCCITPSFYDPITFSPYKNIVLYVPLEGDSDVEKRKYLHIMLDKILDNKDNEYTSKGEKGLIIKGYFEK